MWLEWLIERGRKGFKGQRERRLFIFRVAVSHCMYLYVVRFDAFKLLCILVSEVVSLMVIESVRIVTIDI